MTNNLDYRTVCVTFDGYAGDKIDLEVMEILDQFDGEFISAGTFLGDTPQRDMEYHIHKDRARVIKKALKALKVNVLITHLVD
jgi:hypothetical protein